MNFESFEFKDMTEKEFYNYVKERCIPLKRMYLFFDEVQRYERITTIRRVKTSDKKVEN